MSIIVNYVFIPLCKHKNHIRKELKLNLIFAELYINKNGRKLALPAPPLLPHVCNYVKPKHNIWQTNHRYMFSLDDTHYKSSQKWVQDVGS